MFGNENSKLEVNKSVGVWKAILFIIESGGRIMDKKGIRKEHILILKGKRGKQIFEHILNGPKVPFERLRKGTDEAIAKIVESRKHENK